MNRLEKQKDLGQFTYKAFISYAHADKAWVSWLHRALESYRVPRRLVGAESSFGPIPARISPVFRDRDELSSGHNLSAKIEESLQQSETLILVCSPAAVASHWVNEEVRRFRELGRGERIFCLLVDGEAGSDLGQVACFPPALLDTSQEAPGTRHQVPLAADPRKWADGKRLALLKLVAGLLGARLDELRQRDRARRRKWQLAIALAGFAALSLAGIAIQSSIAAQHQREKAEQLANFVVDLGERVQSDVDLDTRAAISSEAMKHLESLDRSQLSKETSIKVGLALRQLGLVNEGQGHPAEALEAYSESLRVFTDLYEKFGQDLNILFELSQAEFYVGSLHFNRGDYALAQQPIEAYYSISRELLAADPENPNWLAELSYSVTSLAAWQMASGAGVNAGLLDQLDEALRLLNEARAGAPDNADLLSHYSTTLAWAADAQMNSCQLQSALSMRLETLDYASRAAAKDPSDNDLKSAYAYAATGVALVQLKSGLLEQAESSLQEASRVLTDLLAADTSNMVYQRELSWRQLLLARVFAGSGRLDEALVLIAAAETGLTWSADENTGSGSTPADYMELLLWRSEIEIQSGDQAAALSSLDLAARIAASPELEELSFRLSSQLGYLQWVLGGMQTGTIFQVPAELQTEPVGPYRACELADMDARLSVMAGQDDRAKRQVAFLLERGYTDPSFMSYCRQAGLCESKTP